jgi:hypothetical protein
MSAYRKPLGARGMVTRSIPPNLEEQRAQNAASQAERELVERFSHGLDPEQSFARVLSCQRQSRNSAALHERLGHSALIPAALMIGHHFSISAF